MLPPNVFETTVTDPSVYPDPPPPPDAPSPPAPPAEPLPPLPPFPIDLPAV